MDGSPLHRTFTHPLTTIFDFAVKCGLKLNAFGGSLHASSSSAMSELAAVQVSSKRKLVEWESYSMGMLVGMNEGEYDYYLHSKKALGSYLFNILTLFWPRLALPPRGNLSPPLKPLSSWFFLKMSPAPLALGTWLPKSRPPLKPPLKPPREPLLDFSFLMRSSSDMFLASILDACNYFKIKVIRYAQLYR